MKKIGLRAQMLHRRKVTAARMTHFRGTVRATDFTITAQNKGFLTACAQRYAEYPTRVAGKFAAPGARGPTVPRGSPEAEQEKEMLDPVNFMDA